MKKLFYLSLLTLVASATSCKTDDLVDEPVIDPEAEIITLCADIDSIDATRISMEDSGVDAVKLTWQNSETYVDSFSLYDANGGYVGKFLYVGEDGKNSGNFSSNEAILMSDGAEYTAMFPHIDSDSERSLSEREQLAIESLSQAGTANAAHIEQAMRMSASFTYNATSTATMSFKHECAVVSLDCSSFELTPRSITFYNGDDEYTLNYDLSDAGLFYFLVNPIGDGQTERDIKVSILATNGNIYSYITTTQEKYEAGCIYRDVISSFDHIEYISLASDITIPVVQSDYTYKTVGSYDIPIYHFAAENALQGDPRPAVIFFHGGGWTSGAWSSFEQHCRYLATQGVVCFSAKYRLWQTEYDGVTASMLDCLRDAKSAVRWVKENAELFNIDPDRILTGGGSAGGNLAAGISVCDKIYDENDDLTISLDLAGHILLNPVINNDSSTGFATYGANNVATWAAYEGLTAADFSPMSNIDGDIPPSVFLVGETDTYIPTATSIEYQRLVEAAGSTCELWFHANQGHSFYNFSATNATGFVATVPYIHEFMRSIGCINDNSSQLYEWLTYNGYTTYSYTDNFLYDTSIPTIASDFVQWCSDNDPPTELPLLGTNLVVNPDFETGDIEGWTPDNASYHVVLDDASLVIYDDYSLNSSGSWQKLHQTIQVVPGERYYFGFTGRHMSGGVGVSGEYDAPSGGTYKVAIRSEYTGSDLANASISSGVNTNTWNSISFAENMTQVDFTLIVSGSQAVHDNFFFALSADRESEMTGTTIEGFDPFPELETPATTLSLTFTTDQAPTSVTFNTGSSAAAIGWSTYTMDLEGLSSGENTVTLEIDPIAGTTTQGNRSYHVTVETATSTYYAAGCSATAYEIGKNYSLPVALELASQPTDFDSQYPNNLLVNGDFEDGLFGWTDAAMTKTADNQAILAYVTDQYAVSDNKTLIVRGNWQYVYQMINVEAGKTYNYGFTARKHTTESPEGENVSSGNIKAYIGSATGAEVSGQEITLSGTGYNTSTSGTFTATATETRTFMIAALTGATSVGVNTAYVYYDNCYFEEVGSN